MELPEELALKAFADGVPLPGAWFMLQLPTSKNPVVVVLGPADEHGELKCSREDLSREHERAVSTGIMDHGAWTQEIFVQVVSREDLPGLRRGYELWAPAVPFSADYLEKLEVLEGRLAAVAGGSLAAECGWRGPANVRATTRLA